MNKHIAWTKICRFPFNTKDCMYVWQVVKKDQLCLNNVLSNSLFILFFKSNKFYFTFGWWHILFIFYIKTNCQISLIPKKLVVCGCAQHTPNINKLLNFVIKFVLNTPLQCGTFTLAMASEKASG